MGNPIVRDNLMNRKGYSPYCGNAVCSVSPRTRFNGKQFACSCCGWVSEFPADFIDKYIEKWKLSYFTDLSKELGTPRNRFDVPKYELKRFMSYD